MVKDHIVVTGETYFLFEYSNLHITNSRMVRLIDTFYFNNSVYLLLTDLLSQEILLRNLPLNKEQPRCLWKLFDVDTLRDVLFAKYELSYPERNIHNNDDLLELDTE